MGLVKRVLSGLGSRTYCLNQMNEPLPRERCFACPTGILIDGIVDEYVMRVGGFEVIVPDIERRRCSTCGEECFTMAEATKIEDRIKEARKAGVKHRS